MQGWHKTRTWAIFTSSISASQSNVGRGWKSTNLHRQHFLCQHNDLLDEVDTIDIIPRYRISLWWQTVHLICKCWFYSHITCVTGLGPSSSTDIVAHSCSSATFLLFCWSSVSCLTNLIVVDIKIRKILGQIWFFGEEVWTQLTNLTLQFWRYKYRMMSR